MHPIVSLNEVKKRFRVRRARHRTARTRLASAFFPRFDEVTAIDGVSFAIERGERVAFIGPEAIALNDGVMPGERVVTDGALYLQDDERIEIVADGKQVVGSLDVGPDPKG